MRGIHYASKLDYKPVSCLAELCILETPCSILADLQEDFDTRKPLGKCLFTVQKVQLILLWMSNAYSRNSS